MTRIQLVREPVAISPADADAARRVLFGIVHGLGDANRRAWGRFVGRLMRLEPGEIAEIEVRAPRSGPFHRRHFKLENVVFEAQERFTKLEDMRVWLKVGAGFVDWHPGPRGGVIPVPRSMKFSELEDVEMRQLHDDMVEFLRTEHAQKTLWPHLVPTSREEMIETILRGFNE